MCIKFAPYLHQKSANWALNMVLCWCYGAVHAPIILIMMPNLNLIKLKILLNSNKKMNFLQHCIKLVQMRYHKDAVFNIKM